MNGDNLKNLRRETSRTFRNKKREYPNAKLMSLKLIIKTKISEVFRGMNEFKKEHQPRINIIKDENGNLLADPRVS
jgi:hypothetical protein